MFRLQYIYGSKRFLTVAVVQLCLLLATMGMRIPDLTRLKSSKPRPRPVLEVNSKAEEKATTRGAMVGLCSSTLTLTPRRFWRTNFDCLLQQFQSLPLPRIGARAPPTFS